MSDIMIEHLTNGMRTYTVYGSIGDCSFYGCGDWSGPYLSVNRNTLMPSELSEAGFHTNPTQNQLNMNDDWKRLEARTFYWSILDFHQIQHPIIRILTGIVTNIDNDVPVNGAEISVNGRIYVTDTYESLFYQYSEDPDLLHNGFYYFEDIEVDSVEVIVSAEGFYGDTAVAVMVDDFFTYKDFKLISSVPPYLTSTTPEDDSTGISILEDILIQFSRPMNKESVDSTLIISPDIHPVFIWRNNDQELVIRSDSLKFLTDYTITISGQSEDKFKHLFDGNHDGIGGDDFVLTFKTGEDYFAPVLENIYPSLNQKNMELKPIISLAYDEELDSTSVTEEIIKLERFSDESGAEGKLGHYVIDKRSVINFFPDFNLFPDEVYVTRVYPGLKDKLGNEVTNTTSIPFTTGKDDITVTRIDDFESGVDDWWQPDASGSTTGYKEGIYRDSNTKITNTLTESHTSMELFYHWDVGVDAWLIRLHLPAAIARNIVFDTSYVLQVYIFGDGGENKFRFALDEGDATGWPNHEVSQWYTIDWIGWKLVEWDLSDPTQVGDWIGNAVLDGTRYSMDSFQLQYEDGANEKGSIHFDDLQLVKKYNVLTISEGESVSPEKFSLSQNSPNPFNPITHIRFSLYETNITTLKIYDIIGKKVQTLVSERLSPGEYEVVFEAGALASGTYFYVLNSGPHTIKKKMTLLK
jgi:hypothetical protein